VARRGGQAAIIKAAVSEGLADGMRQGFAADQGVMRRRRPPLGQARDDDDSGSADAGRDDEEKVELTRPLRAYIQELGLPDEFMKYLPCDREVPKFLQRAGSRRPVVADDAANVGEFARQHRAEALQYIQAAVVQMFKVQIAAWKAYYDANPDVPIGTIAQRW